MWREYSENRGTGTVTQKREYQAPQLVRYGALRTLTQAANSGNAEGGGQMNPNMSTGGSDRAIKESIVRIGEHPLGIGLYLFDYKAEFRNAWGHGRQFGVMAQEVETVMPEAVAMHRDGYKTVNYTMLGISRTTH